MKFEYKAGSDGSWEIQTDGWIYVEGIGGSKSREWFSDIQKSLAAALAEYDRQVEANKPKPGEFEVGDIVRSVFPGDSSVRYKVVDPFNAIAKQYPGDTFLVREDNNALHRGAPAMFVKVED